MQRILVVGGTGFIGCAFVELLAKSDIQFLCLGRTSVKDQKNRYRYIQMDIMSPDYDFSAIREFGPTTVVYLAWHGIPDFSLMRSLENLQMSVRFLDKVLSSCLVKKVIVSGSCWESGFKRGQIQPEQWLASSEFTWAKKTLFDWLLMRKRSGDFTLIWARLFFVFGKGQRSASLIPMLCRSILANGVLPELRSASDRLDYVDVEDVAEVLYLMCKTKCPSGVYNVGRGEAVAVSDIANFLFYLRDDDNARFELKTEEINHGSKVNFWANIEKTRDILGWTPKSTLEEGLRSVFQQQKLSLKNEHSSLQPIDKKHS